MPKPLTAKSRVTVARRRKMVADLLVMGGTYAEIAEAVTKAMGAEMLPPKWGEAAAKTDAQRIRQRIDAASEGQIEHARGLEIARLNALVRSVMPAALGSAATEASPGVAPDLAAVDRVIKIGDRRARLLGLDAPNRHQHGGAIDLTGATDAELAAIAAGKDPGAA